MESFSKNMIKWRAAFHVGKGPRPKGVESKVENPFENVLEISYGVGRAAYGAHDMISGSAPHPPAPRKSHVARDTSKSVDDGTWFGRLLYVFAKLYKNYLLFVPNLVFSCDIPATSHFKRVKQG